MGALVWVEDDTAPTKFERRVKRNGPFVVTAQDPSGKTIFRFRSWALQHELPGWIAVHRLSPFRATLPTAAPSKDGGGESTTPALDGSEPNLSSLNASEPAALLSEAQRKAAAAAARKKTKNGTTGGRIERIRFDTCGGAVLLVAMADGSLRDTFSHDGWWQETRDFMARSMVPRKQQQKKQTLHGKS